MESGVLEANEPTTTGEILFIFIQIMRSTSIVGYVASVSTFQHLCKPEVLVI